MPLTPILNTARKMKNKIRIVWQGILPSNPVLVLLLGMCATLGTTCILLGRAEAFASRNSVVDSALDGLGCGIGFTLALTILGAVRELLGTGSLFGFALYPEDYGMLLFVLAPGAFIALGYVIALTNVLLRRLCKGNN